MSNDDHHNLPNELDRALRRATGRTLTGLTALRWAVRDHVHKQRARGNDLDEIQLQLRAILTQALEGVAPVEHTDDGQGALALQVIQWSSAFYTESAPS